MLQGIEEVEQLALGKMPSVQEDTEEEDTGGAGTGRERLEDRLVEEREHREEEEGGKVTLSVIYEDSDSAVHLDYSSDSLKSSELCCAEQLKHRTEVQRTGYRELPLHRTGYSELPLHRTGYSEQILHKSEVDRTEYSQPNEPRNIKQHSPNRFAPPPELYLTRLEMGEKEEEEEEGLGRRGRLQRSVSDVVCCGRSTKEDKEEEEDCPFTDSR